MSKNIPVPIQSQSQVPTPFNYNDNNSPYQGVINVPSSFNIDDNSNNISRIRNKGGKFYPSNCKLRLQYFFTIFTLFIIIVDITIQIYFEFANIFAMIDNFIILLLLSKLLVMCIYQNNFYSKRLSLIIALIIIFGFCLKGFSISYCLMKENPNLIVIYGLVIGIRTFGLIWILPLTCRQ